MGGKWQCLPSRNNTSSDKAHLRSGPSPKSHRTAKEVCPSGFVPLATCPPAVGPTWGECRLSANSFVATIMGPLEAPQLPEPVASFPAAALGGG